MVKLNYTILNASALNASRLNMTGEAGKPGGGGGGYWPEGTPAAIRKSAVLWYDIALQGATNETMAEHPYLKDLTGNGHDMELRNFAWTEESGISTVNYPGALVTDGVDDYGYVEGLPLLTKEKGFTVMAVRKWLSEGIVTALASKAENATDWGGAFVFEGVEGGGTAPFNRAFNGANYVSYFTPSDFSFLTTHKYNDRNITHIGDVEDNDRLVFFRLFLDDNNRYGKFVFYRFILFDRDLTRRGWRARTGSC